MLSDTESYVYKLHEMNVYSVDYGRFSKDDEYWECGGRLPHLVSELRVGIFFEVPYTVNVEGG